MLRDRAKRFWEREFERSRMAFRPINDDHSIQAVAFTVALDKPIQVPTVVRLQNEPASWRQELLATELQQFVEFPAIPQPVQLRGTPLLGIDFSRKRPDGAAAWSLRFWGPNISVETTMYTRWSPVWSAARGYFDEAFRRLAEIDPSSGLQIVSIGLWMVDVFVSEEADPNFSELFAPSSEISPALLSRGPNWHSHTGWFINRPIGNCLQNLNVDCQPQARSDLVSGKQISEATARITHSQITTIGTPFDLRAVDFAAIDSEMEAMHNYNKVLLGSILEGSVKKRIMLEQAT